MASNLNKRRFVRYFYEPEMVHSTSWCALFRYRVKKNISYIDSESRKIFYILIRSHERYFIYWYTNLSPYTSKSALRIAIRLHADGHHTLSWNKAYIWTNSLPHFTLTSIMLVWYIFLASRGPSIENIFMVPDFNRIYRARHRISTKKIESSSVSTWYDLLLSWLGLDFSQPVFQNYQLPSFCNLIVISAYHHYVVWASAFFT